MRGALVHHVDLARLLQLIRAEFEAMPGSCLTTRQAARLWSVDTETAQRALDTLVADKVLRVTAKGYLRA